MAKSTKGFSKVLKKGLKGVTKMGIEGLASSVTDVAEATSEVSTVVNHQIDGHIERHKDDVKIPDVKGLPTAQAQQFIQDYGLVAAVLIADPQIAYADKAAGVVVRTEPKVNTIVKPGTFVKIYWLNEEVLEASKVLAQETAEKKIAKASARKALATKLVDGTKANSARLAHAVTKVAHHKHEEQPEILSAKPLIKVVEEAEIIDNNDESSQQ
jgi:hypothetical protein